MMTTAVLIVLALIAGVLIFAATKPDVFQIERKAVIQAAPEKIFALINDFSRWGAWSPWEKKDPGMKRRFSVNTGGEGASYAWEGNKEVGKGDMEIIESTPPSKVCLRLDFEKPFEAHNTVTFTLTPEGNATRVSWKMEGPVPYFFKIMHVFINMDRMCGRDFETGLANLKALAEK